VAKDMKIKSLLAKKRPEVVTSLMILLASIAGQSHGNTLCIFLLNLKYEYFLAHGK